MTVKQTKDFTNRQGEQSPCTNIRTMAKKEKKYWYLHIEYVDNYGMQHALKYKMPKDFQDGVACVFGKKNGCKEPYFTYE